jgi:hypothetical protein
MTNLSLTLHLAAMLASFLFVGAMLALAFI